MKKEIRVVDQEKRILQVTTTDERWYVREGINQKTGLPTYDYIPSVTWIAGFYPKGIAFYKWLANKGWDEAEAIKSAAGDKGSKVHLAIADLIDGKTIKINSKYLNKTTEKDEELTLEEYECIMSFADWFKKFKPKVLEREFVVFNEEQKYAGTVDLYCKIKDKEYVIDLKTSQYIWPEHELQISAYKHAFTQPVNIAILQLGYNKNKTFKFKFTETEDCFDVFLAAKQIWAKETEGIEPKQRDFPLEITLKPEEKKVE